MDTDTASIEKLSARVSKLENQNRRLRRIAAVIAILGAALFVMAQTTRKPRIIEGERFVLKDTIGQKRAELVMEAGGPGLVLYDSDANRVGRFGAVGDGNGASMSLQGPGGASRLTLISLADGPHLLLFDANGKFRGELGVSARGATLLLNDTSEKPRVALAVEADAPMLQINDRDGYAAVLGSNSLITAQTQEKQKTNAASLILFGKEKEIVWRAP